MGIRKQLIRAVISIPPNPSEWGAFGRLREVPFLLRRCHVRVCIKKARGNLVPLNNMNLDCVSILVLRETHRYITHTHTRPQLLFRLAACAETHCIMNGYIISHPCDQGLIKSKLDLPCMHA